MVNFCWLRGGLLSSLLMFFTPFIANATVVHRAVEPARVLLDITLHDSDLTLLLSIPAVSLPWNASGQTPQTLVEHLHEPVVHWAINNRARCSELNKRIFLTEQDIQVVYEFACRAPHRLKRIRPELQAFLPGLRQINTWVSMDSWQDKQAVHIPGGLISLPTEIR